ncbi:phosphoribosylglycinamide formyltransferase [Thermodesulfovibrionales bacterium]|nr:phosphoribosylglycinamide formyltransferase [Thermodesulfovibrionales bacterium]MCL0036875.1 phosphoribosylglycinamide formyltransferase [Thermodesulfovibrionales bacterium]MCL0047257.1 phosphoribosylglycinamide formyltransferase [Thermodesulfovibrionales bacterium]MCL0051412.1 phosphoribosylglycinamide formyltransferase [Thermodesulfovibrionales bacterium]MCL0071405.1 phosphoribosylglycinamide formyltransferase [Thermodesulfovibrionales bacterium]
MLNVGVLASGSGSNFQAIIDEVAAGRLNCQIKLLIVDNPNAYAIERAKRHSIECLYINPDEFPTEDIFFIKVAMELRARDVELVVLAGFMRIVGKLLVDAFPGKIMNIHPALLPSFPGLYSQKQAIDYSVKISGCTVHFVDEGVDTGPVIIQAAVPVSPEDTEKTLSERILKLEHKILPEAIRLYAEGRLEIKGRVVKIEGCETRNECIINPPLR